MNVTTCLEVAKKIIKTNSPFELMGEFRRVLRDYFNYDCTVYSIFERRLKVSSHEKVTIASKFDDLANHVILDDSRDHFRQCIETKALVHGVSIRSRYKQCYFPVVENSVVTHVVEVECLLKSEQRNGILAQIIDLFTDHLLLLRSRDRDPLTGLLNRQAFNRFMFNRFRQNKDLDSQVSFSGNYNTVAIMDIDHFKNVNDTFGHLMGDETLILFSQIMRNTFRHDDIIVRLGGEEFLVLLNEVHAENTEAILERNRKNVEEFLFPQVGQVTISTGISEIDYRFDPLLVVDQADRALYYAKSNGRNQVQSYDALLRDGRISAAVSDDHDVELF
jgi:diguanylate cyclase (GGDEF)-like protein